jgi:hypothetical protein
MNAACRPLHPDVVAIMREGLKEYGLLPSSGGATDGAAAVLSAPDRVLSGPQVAG